MKIKSNPNPRQLILREINQSRSLINLCVAKLAGKFLNYLCVCSTYIQKRHLNENRSCRKRNEQKSCTFGVVGVVGIYRYVKNT